MKRYIAVILLFASLLTACGKDTAEQTEFWVVTEQSEGGGMNHQTEMLIEQFEEEHPGVTVRLDILPGGEEARTAYLQKIRSEVMSGGGPDVYLMPTAPQPFPSEETGSTSYMEPLYRDVVQQMYNGIFTDISEYYDADEALNKEALVTGVMDAGTMDGARYVLPLRFTYDVLLVDMDAVAGMGIDPSVFEGGVDELYDLALELDDEFIAHALNVTPTYCLLSDFIDRQAGNVLLDAGEIEELLSKWQAVTDLENIEAHQDEGYWVNHGELFIVTKEAYEGYHCDIHTYFHNQKRPNRIFSLAGHPFYRMSLSDCIEAAAAIKRSGENIAMYPIRAVDGSLVAEVTYFGAVGSGCQDPQLAYEFLRLFLTEEVQWEQYWPRNAELSTVKGLVEAGYPVCTIGSAEPFYENIRARLQKEQDEAIREKFYTYVLAREKFLEESFVITDEDIPLLSVTVEEARFPVITTEGSIVDQQLAQIGQSGGDAAQIQQMLDDLQWLIAES